MVVVVVLLLVLLVVLMAIIRQAVTVMASMIQVFLPAVMAMRVTTTATAEAVAASRLMSTVKGFRCHQDLQAPKTAECHGVRLAAVPLLLALPVVLASPLSILALPVAMEPLLATVIMEEQCLPTAEIVMRNVLLMQIVVLVVLFHPVLRTAMSISPEPAATVLVPPVRLAEAVISASPESALLVMVLATNLSTIAKRPPANTLGAAVRIPLTSIPECTSRNEVLVIAMTTF
jgi:hypothetical protein